MYTIAQQIAKCAESIRCSHYQSQPLSKDYSRPYRTYPDTPVASQIQEAFLKAVVRTLH